MAFGAERDITYAHVLGNIAALTQTGGCLGVCGLLPQMEAYQAFEDAVLHVQAQPLQDPSVINSSLVSAVRGNYGNYHLTSKTQGSRLWISPFMTLYWFFECAAVAQRNLFLPHLGDTLTFRDALQVVMEYTRTVTAPSGEQGPALSFAPSGTVRAFHRVPKLARTVADLAGSKTIQPAHLAEAI